MYELVKLASLLVYPLGFAFLVGGVGVVLQLFGRRRFGLFLVLFAGAWLWLWSMPWTAEALKRSVEGEYASVPIDALPTADAVVVLGGAFSYDPAWLYPQASGSVDRYWHAARLFHAGRARRVILSGGRDPRRPENPTEAQSGAGFLMDMGVPRDAILLDNEARTTRENAVNVDRMLEANDLQTFLLVTSASHMRRSLAVFGAAGLDPIPVATDFAAPSDPVRDVRRFVPSVVALSKSTSALHEYVGFWYYRMRGWM